MKTILIAIMVCGQLDTVIIKQPGENPVYTHDLYNKSIQEEVIKIMKKDPVIISYEDDRSFCI